MRKFYEGDPEDCPICERNKPKCVNLSVEWPCPVCGEIMRNGMMHHRIHPKPSVYEKKCKCGFSMIWFETKDGVLYTLDAKEKNND